ncbi:GEVED domain-containing protein [Psychroserpens algicola]|uniref:GEVED domain-containing protein n=1 Tax=Psychroserpens algicola TaxID=1719034 RepID=UPI0019534105|nr:GEVED domain-containing protein [Psychroserpens algicola]
MKINIHFIFCLLCFTNLSVSQSTQNETSPLTWEQQLEYRFVPSIADQIKNNTFIAADLLSDREKLGRPKLWSGNKVVPGKGSQGPDQLAQLQRNAPQQQMRSTNLVFDSTTNTATPSDPTGAIGLDFYIASWNTAFQIFNRDGSPAAGMPNAADLATVFGENPGDPIVLYDAAVDRYILTQFSGNPNGFSIAVSQTNNPVTGGWHVYSSSAFQTGAFPDYTKFSIWSDAYYITANIGGGNGNVWAIERDKMLVGDPTASIQAFTAPGLVTSGFFSPQVFNVGNSDLPATGNATMVYMQDDAWDGVDDDHLKLWTINVDWVTPANSSISTPIEVPVTDFTGVFDGGGFNNLQQPNGISIDAMQAIIMNQAQFRKFATHNSVVFNFVVDAGVGEKLAAVRWYELRQAGDGQPWSIYQEGTYIAPEGRHAFAASMGMDATGSIAMAYSSVSTTESVSLRYTGRFDGDPLNVMTGIEEIIVQSNTDNPTTRYADYSHLTIDPLDNETFWFTSEYFRNGNRRDAVASFQITAPLPNDVGITAITTPENGVLSNMETITVTVRNFGENEQSNIPVGYTINGGTAINETFAGPIAAGETASYVFIQNADMSINGQDYEITAFTGLTNDDNTTNDSFTKLVTNAVVYCEPSATISCFVDGIKQFILADISVDDGGDGCNTSGASQGYADRTDQMTNLDSNAGNNVYTLQAQTNWNGGANIEALSVWIDFNDNGTFEDSERLISGAFFTAVDALVDFTLTIPTDAALGTHVLRAKAIDTSANGDILNPCSDFSYGEVQDYSVTIIDSSLSLPEIDLNNSEFSIVSHPNNQFEIILKTPINDTLNLSVYTIGGQILTFNNIEKESNDAYRYELDMSYVSSGVYVVKIGRGTVFKSAKIIVK